MEQKVIYIPNERCHVHPDNQITLPNGTNIVGEKRYVFTEEEMKTFVNKIKYEACYDAWPPSKDGMSGFRG